VQRVVTIASGYSHRPNPASVELGPSGLAYDAQHDILYAASSSDNAIYAINGAGAATASLGTGAMIFDDATKLHGPVNLVLAPNGHLIVANSDGSNIDPNQPSELVEFTTGGQFIGEYSIDQGSGAAFGITVTSVGPATVRLAAVDDSTNSLKTFTTVIQ
jgi:DNA-binding beta-propeller fold protein YncE